MLSTPKTRSVNIVSSTKLWADVVAQAVGTWGIEVSRIPMARLAESVETDDPDCVVVVGDPGHHRVLASIAPKIGPLPVGVLHPLGTCSCIAAFPKIHDVSPPSHAGLRDLGERIDAMLRGTLAQFTNGTGSAAITRRSSSAPMSTLTATQYEVLYLVSLGYRNVQIAAHRETSVRAVEALLSRMFTRLAPLAGNPGNARVAATRAFLELAS